MRCFGKYNRYDRICELCATTNSNEANKCIKETQNIKEVGELAMKCEFRESYFDKDRDWHYHCTKMDGKCNCGVN